MSTVTSLDTIPRTVDVTTDSIGTWAVSFAAAITAAGAASISSCSVALYLATPPEPEAAVVGFVTSATINSQTVRVAWTGAVLTKGKTYRLETLAILDTGQHVEFLSYPNCVA